jgi:shikimate kinase
VVFAARLKPCPFKNRLFSTLVSPGLAIRDAFSVQVPKVSQQALQCDEGMEKAGLPARISRIVLVGFMGAGKSTIGVLLARQLQWRFLDADTVLQERSGSSIAEIFSRHGELEFRRLEAETIGNLVREDRLVLAVGGGAVETEAIRQALLCTPETCVVFLEAPLEVMIARCEQQPGAAVRPILKDRERLLSRFEARLPHYRNAHLVVETASLTPEGTTKRIIEAVRMLIKESTLA